MRIMIIGRPGSGKSTFAKLLGSLLSLPVYHIDQHFFTAGWTPRPIVEFLAWQEQCVAQDDWIIEGCSRKTFEMRFARADVVIFLDFSRWRCLWRVFKRLLFRSSRAEKLPVGCAESLSWPLLKYLWEFDQSKPEIYALRDTYSQVQFFEPRSTRELAWVAAELLEQRKQ